MAAVISSHRLDLAGGIVAYFLCSLGGVAAVKLLNYHFCFASWVVLALLSRGVWVFAYPFHEYLQWRDGVVLGAPSTTQLKVYAGIAVGLTAVEVLNTVSMTVLPGSLYALLKGSDIGWSMVLSRVFLKKSYNRTRVAAAVIVIAGIVVVFAFGAPLTSHAHKEAAASAAKAAHLSPAGAAALCVVGAFVNSLLAVVTERTLKATLAAEGAKMVANATSSHGASPPSPMDDRRQPLTSGGRTAVGAPSKLMLSNAYAMYTSGLSFAMLLAVAVASGEILRVGGPDMGCDDAATPSGAGGGVNTTSQDAGNATSAAALCAFAAALLAVSVSRFAERLAKHWICVRDSAMTFSLVQAARRLSAVFILAIVFREDMPYQMLAGAAVAGCGFVLHWYGGRESSKNQSKNAGGAVEGGADTTADELATVAGTALLEDDDDDDRYSIESIDSPRQSVRGGSVGAAEA